MRGKIEPAERPRIGHASHWAADALAKRHSSFQRVRSSPPVSERAT